MRVSLIHNPKAGNKGPSKKKLIKMLRRAGYDPVYHSTKKSDWDSFIRDPGEFAIIAGGDGTIRKVATRVIGQNVPIALLPLGTANNISKSLGVYGSPEAVIGRWAESRRKKFDAGLITTPWGDARFLEGVGIGLFSKAMSILDITDDKKQHEFSSSKDKLYRDISALMVLASEISPFELRVTLDGEDISGRFLLVEAMNTNFVGPNLRLAVGADPGDGQLDLVSVTEDEREKLEAYLANCLCGKESASDISIRRGRHLQIYLDRDEFHVDDKIWPGSEDYSSAASNGPVLIDIKLQPGALEMLV